MKFKKLFAAMALFVPTVALISASCKNEKPKPIPVPDPTPKLDELKTLINDFSEENIKSKHKLEIFEGDAVNQDDFESGQKVVTKKDYETFKAELEKAKAIVEEGKAEEAKANLKKAFETLEATHKVGNGNLPNSIKFINDNLKVEGGVLNAKDISILINVDELPNKAKKLIIPEKIGETAITELGEQIFSQLGFELDEIEIRAKIKIIGQRAFAFSKSNMGKVNIKKFILPNSLEKIENSAFSNYVGGELVIPTGVKFSGHYHFINSKITKLVLPADLTEIAQEAFHAAEIQELKIPETVTKINLDAFKKVTINKLIIKQTLYDTNKVEFDKATQIKEIQYIK
ncbi:leucine rich repeat (LRR) protein [Metamycoplasma subdolum]|uniref:Leucine rich repeat (LRR) protein n=1 Tax=Metamycoplasma subdolum TaxID=92407 RepID=A0A3M0A031_9BACT|nr:leucine-rich repeat protein [Metamycoplasma subdolum]RMA78481.1 leucine rich repeat (LRR) protein [Metamycoplasma subdolum]